MGDAILRGKASSTRWFAAVLLGLAGALPRLGAVIFLGTGDPAHNTGAPTDDLAGAGWRLTGAWLGFQGVPVGPHHFVTAHHIGGAVGDTFTLNGVTYATTTFQDDSASDLRLWEVNGSFPAWVDLYRGNDEVGRGLVVMGRGLGRGSEVRVGGVLKGWQAGAGDGTLRWGRNTVTAEVDGGPYWGALLRAAFDSPGWPDEAQLATGDSGAPIFIHDGTDWRLAGVAAGVDGPFNTTNTGDGFAAALFDARGLYFSPTPPTAWQLIGGPVAVPTSFYATRISTRAAWIDGIAQPGGSDVPLLSGIQVAGLAGLLAAGAAWRLGRPGRLRAGDPAR